MSGFSVFRPQARLVLSTILLVLCSQQAASFELNVPSETVKKKYFISGLSDLKIGETAYVDVTNSVCRQGNVLVLYAGAPLQKSPNSFGHTWTVTRQPSNQVSVELEGASSYSPNDRSFGSMIAIASIDRSKVREQIIRLATHTPTCERFESWPDVGPEDFYKVRDINGLRDMSNLIEELG